MLDGASRKRVGAKIGGARRRRRSVREDSWFTNEYEDWAGRSCWETVTALSTTADRRRPSSLPITIAFISSLIAVVLLEAIYT
eukprot:6212650-Pleurochrysis_carterae.AAC.4